MEAMVVEIKKVDEESLAAVTYANNIAIYDDMSYKGATEYLKGIKSLIKRIEGKSRPHIEKIDAARKSLYDDMMRDINPCKQAELIIKAKMVQFSQEQEQKRLEEQRRIELELKRQEEERRLAEAVELEKSGHESEAEALLSEPIEAPPVILPNATPKVSGISMRENWKCEVVDFKALVMAAAKGDVPLNVLQPNLVLLGQMARSLKSEMNYPGVRVWAEKTVASGR
jgi:hypothetical protein